MRSLLPGEERRGLLNFEVHETIEATILGWCLNAAGGLRIVVAITILNPRSAFDQVTQPAEGVLLAYLFTPVYRWQLGLMMLATGIPSVLLGCLVIRYRWPTWWIALMLGLVISPGGLYAFLFTRSESAVLVLISGLLLLVWAGCRWRPYLGRGRAQGE